MALSNRPPPSVLLIHNGTSVDAHVRHLGQAGLRVSDAHASGALSLAKDIQPDIIVLDFDCDGEMIEALKGDPLTEHIPIIALAELVRT